MSFGEALKSTNFWFTFLNFMITVGISYTIQLSVNYVTTWKQA